MENSRVYTCGKELIYASTPSTKESCFIYRKEYETEIICTDSHYICDGCHECGYSENVDLMGPAGTGKTLLALASGLKQTVHEELYIRILCARPIVLFGNDIG